MPVGAPPALWPAPQKETRLKLLLILIYPFNQRRLVTLASQTLFSGKHKKHQLFVFNKFNQAGTVNALYAIQQ
jgi:hypothetical protein